jgi:hypothetical protein
VERGWCAIGAEKGEAPTHCVRAPFSLRAARQAPCEHFAVARLQGDQRSHFAGSRVCPSVRWLSENANFLKRLQSKSNMKRQNSKATKSWFESMRGSPCKSTIYNECALEHAQHDLEEKHSASRRFINPHRLFHGVWLPQWLENIGKSPKRPRSFTLI